MHVCHEVLEYSPPFPIEAAALASSCFFLAAAASFGSALKAVLLGDLSLPDASVFSLTEVLSSSFFLWSELKKIYCELLGCIRI